MERSVLQGLAALRWGTWIWMAAGVILSRSDLRRPWLALVLVALALAVTVADTVLLRRDPPALLRPGPVLAELAVGAALLLGDGWAYDTGHAFSTSQSLGSVWPLTGVLNAGVAMGPLVAAAAGAGLALCRIAAVLVNGAEIDSGKKALSLTSTAVFYALGGAVAGYLARLLQRAEQQISAARAREELARTLHDGVLQTLAVIERRADPALAGMAREQERELREFLFGSEASPSGRSRGDRDNGQPAGAPGGGGLGTALRSAAARYENAFGGRAQVVVAEDVPALGPEAVAALAGAAGEALINAGKHGRATQVTVYVEPTEDGGVFCSVKDDGVGFDPATTPEGVGLSRSVRARVAEAGGRTEISSVPGDGAEVCLWLP